MDMYYVANNKPKAEQTASPDKYPQGYFKDKKCKECGMLFTPKAPSELYCSDACKDRGLTSAYLKRNYGMDLADYENLLEKQDHKCAICGTKGFKMQTSHKNLLVVDHNHETGEVRGLLCHNCNRALGLFQDNTDTISNAITYLQNVSTY